MTGKRTLVIGASANPERYSYLAVHALRQSGHDVVGLAKRLGSVADVVIQTYFPEKEDIHTVTMYIGPSKQAEYYKSIIELAPERVIFNPGTENAEFMRMLKRQGIEVVEDCTLMMLDAGLF